MPLNKETKPNQSRLSIYLSIKVHINGDKIILNEESCNPLALLWLNKEINSVLSCYSFKWEEIQ